MFVNVTKKNVKSVGAEENRRMRNLSVWQVQGQGDSHLKCSTVVEKLKEAKLGRESCMDWRHFDVYKT